MGDYGLDKGKPENGADGAYWPDDKNTMIRAILDVQEYRKNLGKPFSSTRLIATAWHDETRPQLEQRFRLLTGKRIDQSAMHWTDDVLKEIWEGTRKGFYKCFATNVTTVSERPLFGIVEGGQTVYAYSGLIATHSGRYIKLGITSKPLNDYLRSLKIKHGPILLAHMLGDEELEKEFKNKWKHRLVDHDEWYWPESDIADWVAETYDHVEPNFWQIINDARDTHPHWNLPCSSPSSHSRP